MEGIYVCVWLIHVVIWQKLTQHCKAVVLQLKINAFFKVNNLYHCDPKFCVKLLLIVIIRNYLYYSNKLSWVSK